MRNPQVIKFKDGSMVDIGNKSIKSLNESQVENSLEQIYRGYMTSVHITENGFYMITSNDKLSGWMRRSSKTLPIAKLAPKKDHGHCLVVCCQSESQ